MRHYSFFTTLLGSIAGLCLLLLGSCESHAKKPAIPHQFTYNRAEMPRPGKPDFWDGDVSAIEFQMKDGYSLYTYVGKCKGYTIFHQISYVFGNDHAIYDNRGFLTFRTYGGCLQTITDSVHYVYDKTLGVLYQIVHRWDSNKADSVYYNAGIDTCYYFFNSSGKLNCKLEKCHDRKRTILTTYSYNKTGSLRSEYTRQYNQYLLELPDTVGSKDVKYYYSKGRKDSVVTRQTWPGEPPYKIETKQTYDAAGNPDSVYRDNQFYYRCRIINREEYLRRTKGRETYWFDEKGGVYTRK